MGLFYSAIFLHALCLANAINFTSVYEWDELDFVWPSKTNGSKGQIEQYFNSSEVYFRYMAVFEERLFLSLDINIGIPATLVWLPTRSTSTAPPKLTPFPSWDLHKYQNCDSIQWAKGMQVDTEGRLWVLDEGGSVCPSKLWIFDLANDTTERVHQFPETLVSHYYKKRFLSETVLDKTPDDYLAYFADYQSEYIIVYSLKTNKSGPIKTPGVKWQSLAVSPINREEARQLWYIIRRSDSKELYSVSLSELKKGGEISAAAKLIGAWPGMPYKMVIDSANVLYAAVFSKNYLSKWNISEPFLEQRFHEVERLGAEWPFSLALDANDTLWVMERNESGINNRHRLLKATVGQSTALPSP
ncbi:protein yellow-like [Cloeon dipterum]|uniref:protein yellow-like n=1 Tax=Cloeon dipterum TaxID=197152 RepID=UPI00321F696F